MGARYQPYMYTAASYEDNDSRFPSKPFDPKAVTRASWERSPPKPKHEGPLVSFNRHPEYVSFTYSLCTQLTYMKRLN